VLFSEDRVRFYYGDRSIDKDLITAARILVNGSPIASVESPSRPPRAEGPAGGEPLVDARPEGIARDRWDVVVETVTGPVVIECGAIRERVSQELAQAVFDAVRRALGRG
jgi:hypothetical protein